MKRDFRSFFGRGNRPRDVLQQGQVSPRRATISGFLAGGVVLIFLASPAHAERFRDPYPNASPERYAVLRVQALEGEVTITRVYEDTVAATLNEAVGEGDTVETGPAGHVELSQGNGLFLRLDANTRVEVLHLALPEEEGSLLVRLSYGRVYVDSQAARYLNVERPPAVRVDTPDGSVWVNPGSMVRLETYPDEGSVILCFIGRAQILHPDGQLTLFPGQGVFDMTPDDLPSPQPAPTLIGDEFEDWNEYRRSELTRWAGGGDMLPPDLRYEGEELYRYGRWEETPDYGYVWIPPVSSPWLPYYQGHWSWVSGAFIWVPYEPWGWVTHHYGFWGFSAGLGWFWIPHVHFSFAWVAWYDADPYVGWCPLTVGYRPLILIGFHDPRTFYFSYLDPDGHPWIFVRDRLRLSTPIMRQKIQYSELDRRVLSRGRIVTDVPASSAFTAQIPRLRLERKGYELRSHRLVPATSNLRVQRTRPSREVLYEQRRTSRYTRPSLGVSGSSHRKTFPPERSGIRTPEGAKPHRRPSPYSIRPSPSGGTTGGRSPKSTPPSVKPDRNPSSERRLPWAEPQNPRATPKPYSTSPKTGATSHRTSPSYSQPKPGPSTRERGSSPPDSSRLPWLRKQPERNPRNDGGIGSFMKGLRKLFTERDKRSTRPTAPPSRSSTRETPSFRTPAPSRSRPSSRTYSPRSRSSSKSSTKSRSRPKKKTRSDR